MAETANTGRVRAPSTIKPDGDLAQVVVDQWGHKGEYVRGDIVKLSELNAADYDAEHALRMGTIRMLSEAEARSLPTTRALDTNLDPDEDHARVMRYHAGFVDLVEGQQPPVVQTASGPAYATPEEAAAMESASPEEHAARRSRRG